MTRRRTVLCALIAACFLPAAAGQDGKTEDRFKEVAGTSEMLRFVPKQFATLQAVDATHRKITLLVDGEKQPKVWTISPDAEIKVAGWWGRLEDIPQGDRVWIWLRLDRNKQPSTIAMLADEVSEQDIHGRPATVASVVGQKLMFLDRQGPPSGFDLAQAELFRGTKPASLDTLRSGESLYVQTAGNRVRLMLDDAALEARREKQRSALRQHWEREGLPGTVTFLHDFSGEMELMLDHEAMRWGRSLQVGDKVRIQAAPPIEGVVKQVRPWRERTQLRLVVLGYDQTDLRLGQRVGLRMTAPSTEVERSPLPPDLDRPRTKDERLDWFLATIYCTCKVQSDTCTGDFYTLSSCNPNACGMPNGMRRHIAQKIDEGKTDRQILEELLKEQGPHLLRSHLLP